MAKNIFIARHGLTQWNLEGKVQGQYVRSRHALLKALTRPFLGVVLTP